jgi:hypothetical protein
MATGSFSDELQAFDTQLTAFYDAFQKKKLALGDSDLLRQNEALRKDLKGSDDKNFYLKRDLEEADAKIAGLQRELEEKSALLSKIGAFARNDLISTATPDRKRDRSPVPDLERKRSRQDFLQPTHSHLNGYYASNRDTQPRVDSGRNTDSIYSLPAAAPGAPMFDELNRRAHSPNVTSKVASYLQSQPEPGIKIMGAAHTGIYYTRLGF